MNKFQVLRTIMIYEPVSWSEIEHMVKNHPGSGDLLFELMCDDYLKVEGTFPDLTVSFNKEKLENGIRSL